MFVHRHVVVKQNVDITARKMRKNGKYSRSGKTADKIYCLCWIASILSLPMESSLSVTNFTANVHRVSSEQIFSKAYGVEKKLFVPSAYWLDIKLTSGGIMTFWKITLLPLSAYKTVTFQSDRWKGLTWNLPFQFHLVFFHCLWWIVSEALVSVDNAFVSMFV